MPRLSRRTLLATSALAALGLGAGRLLPGPKARAQEGAVNLYSSRHYPADELLFQAFTEETGVSVNQIQGKAEELMERLKLEGEQSPCDVFITVDAGNLWRAQEEALFQPIQSSELAANIPAHLRDPQGRWFAFSKRARIIIHDPARIAPGAIKSYEDLADPQWKKRLLIRSSNNIYNQSLMASMIAHHGMDEAESWAKGLVANMARDPKGGDVDQINALIAGEGDLAVSNSYYFARMLAENQEPGDGGEGGEGGEAADGGEGGGLRSLAILFPNQEDRGTHVNVSGAGVAANAPNRDNAVRFLEFLISPKAQEIFSAANYEYPVREGVAASPVIAAWGGFKEDALPVAELGRNNAEAVRVMDRAGWR